uniref:Ig-like domain-containing protein n=1 Tax=Nothobranchius furzeri TaxID=105023 RepID=A0A8C6NSM4_NOTFU
MLCLPFLSNMGGAAAAEHEGPELDVEVFCVFHQSCILPCSFHGASETVIHWTHLAAGESAVHSYYDGEDQLGRQDQNFRGRTSLFQDQISRGNASLLLRGVQVQDGGRYRCSFSITDADMSFVNVMVEAPVSKVNITEVDDGLICSSEGIYPEPELTWSTVPPSNIILKSTTMVRLAEQQLYSISSSLTVSDGSDQVYICTVRTSRSSMEAVTREKTKTGLQRCDVFTRPRGGAFHFMLSCVQFGVLD